MELEKIKDILSYTGQGTLVNLEKENNDLYIFIEVFGYLAEHFNHVKVKCSEERHLWELKYKIIDLKNIKLIDYDNEQHDEKDIFENLSEIIDMDFRLIDVEIDEDENIVIKLGSYKVNGIGKEKIPFCYLYLRANDIKIYNINNCEIKYSELLEFKKEYEECSKKAKK